jgi:hypothetical protein
MRTRLSFYTGIAIRGSRGPYQIVLVGFTPDGGRTFHTQTFIVGVN